VGVEEFLRIDELNDWIKALASKGIKK